MSEQPLTITKDRVLQAAETCPDVKRALKALFPEVFEEKRHPQATGNQITKFSSTGLYVLYLSTSEVEGAVERTRRQANNLTAVIITPGGKIQAVISYPRELNQHETVVDHLPFKE